MPVEPRSRTCCLTFVSRIIFYDGPCQLCQWWVRFLLRADKEALWQFASLQSPLARHLGLGEAAGGDQDSVVVWENGKTWFRSGAVIVILDRMGGRWRMMAKLLRLVPLRWRDGVYRIVARYRNRWWGRTDACLIPPPHVRHRFLEDVPEKMGGCTATVKH